MVSQETNPVWTLPVRKAGSTVEVVKTKERWPFSSDGKTLTIKNDVEFPNSGLGSFQVIEPSTRYINGSSVSAAP